MSGGFFEYKQFYLKDIIDDIKEILENADENSLILIDEIGTGTDPSEGAELATAFLLKISEIN